METNNIKGALLVMVAMTMITTNDAIIKHLTQVFGIGQIMFIRGVLACGIFAGVMYASKRPVLSRRSFHRWNIVRALLELAATFSFLTGLSLLPLAMVSALGFSSPIFLAVLAAIFLRENVNLKRWIVVFCGFIGVLMITNPFQQNPSWAVAFPIACAIFVAFRDLAIRYVPNDIPSMQVAFTNAWVVMIGGGLLSMFQGWGYADDRWYFWFIALAIAIYTGYVTYIIGSRIAELSFIAPFKYLSVVLAILFGYLIWGEKPGLLMLAGAAVITFSGLILLLGERKKPQTVFAK